MTRTITFSFAVLGTLGAAQASPAPTHNPSDALKANSYADLLEPIPDAAKILRALDEQAPPKAAEDSANVKVAQWYHHHHHHHHHHHGYWGGGAPGYWGGGAPGYWGGGAPGYWGGGAPGYWGGGAYVPNRRWYHHHHHHHWYYNR